MRFPSAEFKNDRGAAQEDYDVVLAESLTPYLDRYIRKARPLLAGGEPGHCPYFFRPSPMF
jgi:hypothetical protein